MEADSSVGVLLYDKMQCQCCVPGCQRSRLILALSSSYCDHEVVMRRVRKLNGMSFFINGDVCTASQAQGVIAF